MESIEKNANQISASTVERALAGVGIFAITGGAFFVWLFNPTTAGFFPVCPLFTMTGIACPGCGLTRGFHALFHGDVLTALDYNALLPIFVLLFVYLFVSMFLIAARGRGLSFGKIHPTMIWVICFLAGAFFVARNLPFYPFTILYP